MNKLFMIALVMLVLAHNTDATQATSTVATAQIDAKELAKADAKAVKAQAKAAKAQANAQEKAEKKADKQAKKAEK